MQLFFFITCYIKYPNNITQDSDRVEVRIPEDSIKISKDPFTNSSLYQDVYRDLDRSEWEKVRLPPLKHATCLQIPEGEMSNQTMSRVKHSIKTPPYSIEMMAVI